MVFQNAGFEIVSNFDNWDAAMNVYRLNFKHTVHKADVEQMIGNAVPSKLAEYVGNTINQYINDKES